MIVLGFFVNIFKKYVKLPDKIVFDANRCDEAGVKVGDKISGMYLKGTIDGNNVCVVSVSVITN